MSTKLTSRLRPTSPSVWTDPIESIILKWSNKYIICSQGQSGSSVLSQDSPNEVNAGGPGWEFTCHSILVMRGLYKLPQGYLTLLFKGSFCVVYSNSILYFFYGATGWHFGPHLMPYKKQKWSVVLWEYVNSRLMVDNMCELLYFSYGGRAKWSCKME